MPITKIELKRGLEIASLIQIRDLVLDCITNALQLPADDRNIFITEYEPELFQMKLPYEILIEIIMFSGRTNDAKKKLYQSIVTALDSNNLLRKEQVFIIINEQPMENWGFRGGIPANEMDLGFKVDL
jgi:phenylpyruvate tautomerase PptA (4-oxalocrotonate tautomerase family)